MALKDEIGDLRIRLNRVRLSVEGKLNHVKGGFYSGTNKRRRTKNVRNDRNKGEPRGSIVGTDIEIGEG
jgi:hypothetical protein